MRRIAIVLAALLLAGAVFTAWGAASPAGKSAGAGRAAKPKKKPAAKPKRPPLPSLVKSRKRWEIGVKCDFPPFGFIDVRGRNDGYDVRIARRFAQLAFGSKTKVNLTCVTPPRCAEDKRTGTTDAGGGGGAASRR